MEYWAEHPPAHIVLAAVHLKSRGRRGDKQAGGMREEFQGEVKKFGLGGNAGPLPEVFKIKKPEGK